MSYSVETERYIYNCIRKHNPYLTQRYFEDLLQEIRLAILTSENEMEALKAAGRGYYKLLKGYGYGREFTDLDTPYFDSGNTKKDYLTDDNEERDEDNSQSIDNNEGCDMLSRMIELYCRYKCAKEVCWHLGINYNKQIEQNLSVAYISNI